MILPSGDHARHRAPSREWRRAAPEHISGVAYGTTLVTNAMIERKGARTGLLTTRGFPRRFSSSEASIATSYMTCDRATQPLVPRHLRLGVRRADHRWTIPRSRPPDPPDGLATHRRVDNGGRCRGRVLPAQLSESGPRAPGRAVIQRELGNWGVVSSDVVRGIREYERTRPSLRTRTSRPPVQLYLAGFECAPGDVGVRAPSLPDAFEWGACRRRDGSDDFLCDCSNPSRRPACCRRTRPVRGVDAIFSRSTWAARPPKRASSMTASPPSRLRSRPREVPLPRGWPAVEAAVIDMIEIGAGGGSIARVEGTGLLRSGPIQRGAEPGPACYGLGASNHRHRCRPGAGLSGSRVFSWRRHEARRSAGKGADRTAGP